MFQEDGRVRQALKKGLEVHRLLRGRKTGFRGADGWGLFLVTPWAAMVNMKMIVSEDISITST
jgi:hypothetical protein